MGASGPIQLLPQGLLGLLQLKNVGHNPRELNDSVQPTLDLWRIYLQADSEALFTANIPITAVGGAFPVVPDAQVPNDEIWAVHHFSASTFGVLAAGQELSFMTMVEYGITAGGGGIGVATGEPSRVFVAGEAGHCVSGIPGGYILMPPASQMIVWTNHLALAAGTINANIRARFTRLKI